MKRRLAFVTIIALIIFALLLWAPWISEQYARERAVAEFERAWTGVVDGCGFFCHGCGAVAVEKVAFGAQVTLEYGCGMQSASAPENRQQANVFVSALGQVYGLPEP